MAVESVLDEVVARACTDHPELSSDRAGFAAHLAGHLPPDANADTLHAWHVDDVLLAFACGHGVAVALARFDRAHLARVPAYVARLVQDAAFVDELLQRLRTKLHVRDDEVDSITALVQSRLEVSLRALIRTSNDLG